MIHLKKAYFFWIRVRWAEKGVAVSMGDRPTSFNLFSLQYRPTRITFQILFCFRAFSRSEKAFWIMRRLARRT